MVQPITCRISHQHAAPHISTSSPSWCSPSHAGHIPPCSPSHQHSCKQAYVIYAVVLTKYIYNYRAILRIYHSAHLLRLCTFCMHIMKYQWFMQLHMHASVSKHTYDNHINTFWVSLHLFMFVEFHICTNVHTYTHENWARVWSYESSMWYS